MSAQNKTRSAAAMATIIGLTVANEIYNRTVGGDDYADVTRKTKGAGFPIMSPVPAEGDGKRGLFFIPVRGGPGMVIPIVREAMGRMLGDNPRTWQSLALEVFGSLSPVDPDIGGGALGSITPPVLRLGAELKSNYDTYRQQPIVPKSLEGLSPSEQYGPQTSQVSRYLSKSQIPGFSGQPAVGIDYAVKGFSPGPGEALLGAADAIIGMTGHNLPERPEKGVPGARDVPLIGGIAGRFLRTAGEQRRTDAYDRAQAVVDRSRQVALDSVQNSKTYQASTPDEQQKMIRAMESEMTANAQQREGVVATVKDLGLPNKYLGVKDPAKEQQIDDAISAMTAWKARKGPVPTARQQTLATAYSGRINQRYTLATKRQAREMTGVRATARAAVTADQG